MRRSDPAIREVAARLKESSEAQLAPPPLAETEALLEFIHRARREFDEEFGAIPAAEGVAIAPLEGAPSPGEVYTPEGAPSDRVLLYFHGGGQVFGSALSHRHLVTKLAAEAGVLAWSIDYPLAPEHPFPHGMEAAVALYSYMISTAGFRPEKIVVAGDSGGGNLTMTLVLALKQRGLPLPGGLFLISPQLDSSMSHEAHDLLRHKEKWANQAIIRTCIDLVAAGESFDNPLLSPIKGDLTELPPLLIHVGTDEILLGDSLTLANKAAMGGGDVSLRVYQDMFHGWHLFHPVLQQDGVGAIVEAGAWIRKTLAD